MGPAPPPSSTVRRTELSDFLRSRRAKVAPEQVGLEPNGHRRTPGLRREEVAQLAGVGLSWYTWLEQGRDIHPSPQVLDAVARVLRLDAAERAHLFHLARIELPLPEGDYPREASPALRVFVEAMDPHPLPSHVWLDTPGKILHADERHLEFMGGSLCPTTAPHRTKG